MVPHVNGWPKVAVPISTPESAYRGHGTPGLARTPGLDKTPGLDRSTDPGQTEGRVRITGPDRSRVEAKPSLTDRQNELFAGLMADVTESPTAPSCTTRRIFLHSRAGGIQ